MDTTTHHRPLKEDLQHEIHRMELDLARLREELKAKLHTSGQSFAQAGNDLDVDLAKLGEAARHAKGDALIAVRNGMIHAACTLAALAKKIDDAAKA